MDASTQKPLHLEPVDQAGLKQIIRDIQPPLSEVMLGARDANDRLRDCQGSASLPVFIIAKGKTEWPRCQKRYNQVEKTEQKI